MNYQKQGPGRRTVFWLQMSVLEWQSAYIQRRPERVVLMKVFWGWQYSYSQHFVKVKDFLKCVATSRIQSCWTISNFQKFYKAILQQNNQVTWKKENSIWKLQQIIDFALQNKFINFCSSCILLLVLQAELSVTSSEFRVKEKKLCISDYYKENMKERTCHGGHLPWVQRRRADILLVTRVIVTALNGPQHLFWWCSSDGTLIWYSVSNHYL